MLNNDRMIAHSLDADNLTRDPALLVKPRASVC
jgi:hypothetical protein